MMISMTEQEMGSCQARLSLFGAWTICSLQIGSSGPAEGGQARLCSKQIRD
jgi:hypothetical protein